MSGYRKRNWEPFPMHKIKRVDRPTTLIKDGKVQRVREREGGFCKAAAGDYVVLSSGDVVFYFAIFPGMI
ncbi:MAG: hypothetical protein KG012_04705 [Deltaproteobacteria bacterium]|nr:hypothetical protein [Deltaproteobacteria bacterium]